MATRPEHVFFGGNPAQSVHIYRWPLHISTVSSALQSRLRYETRNSTLLAAGSWIFGHTIRPVTNRMRGPLVADENNMTYRSR